MSTACSQWQNVISLGNFTHSTSTIFVQCSIGPRSGCISQLSWGHLLMGKCSPVTRGKRREASPFLQNFSPLLEKCVGHSLKYFGSLRKLFAPPGVPSWLRAWRNVACSFFPLFGLLCLTVFFLMHAWYPHFCWTTFVSLERFATVDRSAAKTTHFSIIYRSTAAVLDHMTKQKSEW